MWQEHEQGSQRQRDWNEVECLTPFEYRWPLNCSFCPSELFLLNANAVAGPSVCCLSVTLVHRTQPVEIFGNVSTPFPVGTLATVA